MRGLIRTALPLLFAIIAFSQNVNIGEKTVFTFRVSQNGVPAHDRATRPNKILDSLTFTTNVDSSQIELIQYEKNYIIAVVSPDSLAILTIIPDDTTGTGMEQIEVARTLLADIKANMMRERAKSMGLQNVIRLILLILSPIFVIFAFFLLHKASGALSRVVISQEGKSFKGIKFGKLQVLSPMKETKIVLRLISIFKYIAFAIVLYIGLVIFFAQFPQTEGYFIVLTDIMYVVLKFARNVIANSAEILISIAILFIVMKLILAILNFMSSKYELLPTFTGDLTLSGYQALINLIKKIVIAFFFLSVIYVIPGANTLAFVLLIIFVAVIGLACIRMIQDFIAGYLLMVRAIYQEGDTITAVDFKGKVTDRGFLFTEITTEDKSKVVLHNGLVLSKPIIVHKTKKIVNREAENEGDTDVIET